MIGLSGHNTIQNQEASMLCYGIKPKDLKHLLVHIRKILNIAKVINHQDRAYN